MHPDAPLRRITTWLAILGYMLVASGLPLPSGVSVPAGQSSAAKRLATKDRSRSFPCMDKACGCATAEQCFTSCCCNTPAETLAWARAHRVEPAVLAALEQRVAGGRRSVTQVVKSSCCSSRAPVVKESCCTSKQPAITGFEGNVLDTACESRAATPAATCAMGTKPAEPVPAEQQREAKTRTRTVTLRAMLACGGVVAEWFAAGVALPPPRVEVSLATSVLQVCTPGDESGECLRARPAAPPPRAA